MEIEIIKTYHDNGSLWQELSYLDNIQHGTQKWYYDNGQINYHWHFVNNQFHRIDQIWSKDERRNYIQQWKLGESHGPTITFNY